MNLIVFTNLTYKPVVGGVENSFYYMSRSAFEMGYVPIIYVSDVSICEKDKLPLFEESDGVSIYRFRKIRIISFLFFLDPIITIYSAFWGFLRLKKKYGKNIRIIARHHIMACAALLAGMNNIAYLVPSMVKGLNDRKRKELSFRERLKEYLLLGINVRVNIWLQNLVFLKCKDCFVFSLNLKKQIERLSNRKEKIFVVKPGIDTMKFRFDQKTRLEGKRNKNFKDDFIFLCLGRVIEAKGFSDVILAYEKLPDLIKCRSKVLIVGEGIEKPRLIKMVLEKGLSHKILFFNSTSSPSEFYNLSDCFMMTSRYEAFGQTILEAMASGLPVIGYKPDGTHILTATDELVTNDQNGFLCSFDILELSRSMEKIYNKSSDELEMFALNNVNKVKNEFNWNKLIDDLYA